MLAVKGFIRVAFSRLAPASPPDCLRCAVPGRFRAISPELPEHRHVEHHFFAESILLVRDDAGRYVPASPEQTLDAARQATDVKMKRGAAFTSPETVKTFLQTKLAGFEQEMFAALFLDNRHRLIEYVELFRGTIDTASVYPREW